MKAAAQLTCSRCPTPISGKGRTDMCSPCATRENRKNPEKEARRLARLRVVHATPEHRERKRVARNRLEAERKDDPAWKACKRASGKRLRAAYDADPAAQAANQAKRGLVGRKLSNRWLAWCPPERREEYQKFRAKVGAPEARRIIEETMTTFERQLARVRAGARVVDKIQLARTSPAFTLGGVASALL
jgi:hypothetical protein